MSDQEKSACRTLLGELYDESMCPGMRAEIQDHIAKQEAAQSQDERVAGQEGTPNGNSGDVASVPPTAPTSLGGSPELTPVPVNPEIVETTRAVEEQVLASGKPDAVQKLAGNYLRGGSPRDAERVVTTALAERPDDASLLSVRARTRALAGDTEGAVADARRVLLQKPDDQVANMILGNRDQLARAAKRVAGGPEFGASAPSGLPEESPVERAQLAAVGLPLAARTPPGGADVAGLYTRLPLAPHAKNLVDSARAKIGMGDYSGAFIDATRAIDAARDSALPLVLRAFVNNRLKQGEAAVADATRALALEPQNAAALRERAYGHIQVGRYEEALTDLAQALRLEPENGTGYYYRAMAHEKLGRAAEALADYEQAVKYDPGLAAALSDARARLSPGSFAASPVRHKKLFRMGAIGASVLLLLLGLVGTQAGRRAATTIKGFLPSGGTPVLQPTSLEPVPGAIVGGSLRVVRELGRGGMGVVYEAFDETLQRRVAIKRLQRTAATTQDDLTRFIQEARTVARLRHPRLAEIYSVLEDADVYLVFEYVEGESIDRVLGKRLRLSVAETRRALSDVAAAVGYAHGQRVIHKDLKPANVVLEPTGGCKVMDFGIAHHALSSGTMLTRTSASGTPPYMSPEQAMGSVSKASDLYALGVMAYEMLVGRRPFQGPDFLEQKLHSKFPAPSSIDPTLPRGLDEFFRVALDPDPTKRPKSADEFISLLDQASA